MVRKIRAGHSNGRPLELRVAKGTGHVVEEAGRPWRHSSVITGPGPACHGKIQIFKHLLAGSTYPQVSHH